MKKSELKDLREMFRKFNGRSARHALLAYAYLRDVPYRDIEPVIEQDRLGGLAQSWFRKSLAIGIAQMIQRYVRCVEEFKVGGKVSAPDPVEIQKIDKWLATKELPSSAIRRAEAYAKYMAMRQAARAVRTASSATPIVADPSIARQQ